MGGCTALLDANVLYPAPVRDLLLQLAVGGMFKVRWTDKIHQEWIENLLRNQPERRRESLVRTRNLMDRAVPDVTITQYEDLIESLTLPDANDRHVLAAAIAGRCDVIVTANLSDFPAHALKPYKIRAQHPDEFLLYHLLLLPGLFCHSVQKVRSRLKNPPYSTDEYLAALARNGLIATTDELQRYARHL